MGRKLRGAALRAHKRATATAQEIVEEAAKSAEQEPVARQSNQELFVIDTTGDLNAPKVAASLKPGTYKKDKKDKPKESHIEQRMVQTLVQKHAPETLKAMVKAGEDKLLGKRRAVARGNHKAKFDLWDNHEDEAKGTLVVPAKKSKQPLESCSLSATAGVKGSHAVTKAQQVSKKPKNTVAVDIAHGGQSYRPDPKQHKQVVKEAVSLEVRRQEAQEEKKAPLATGMSAETRALLVDDSDSDEEVDSDNEQQEVDDEESAVKLQKRPERLTRAERNRQKRLRAERAIQEKERKNKKLLNSVAELPRYKKEIKKVDLQLQEKRNQRTAKQKQAKLPGIDVEHKVSAVDPIHAPTLPVALPSEHKDTSLRTIKPKGSLVTDRMASFVDRNLVSKRKMGDKKRIMQGKRRKLNVKGRGHDIAKSMDMALMG